MKQEKGIKIQNPKAPQEKLLTIKLMFIGVLLISFTFGFAIGISPDILALCWLLSFGVLLAGLIIGYVELKRNNRALIGIVGNLALLILFIVLFLSSIKSSVIVPPS
ncbi:MAG: hypothetical protein ACJA0U_003028 [Salibacteraceae bacterium]